MTNASCSWRTGVPGPAARSPPRPASLERQRQPLFGVGGDRRGAALASASAVFGEVLRRRPAGRGADGGRTWRGGRLGQAVASPGAVERGDPEQPEDELAEPLSRGVVGECRQLLLLGEHRRPEGAVVHAEYRLDVVLRVADALGHHEPVAAGFEARGGVDPAQGAAHQIEVTFVLELHLGDAVAAYAGGTNLLLGGPRPCRRASRGWLRAASASGPRSARKYRRARGGNLRSSSSS